MKVKPIAVKMRTDTDWNDWPVCSFDDVNCQCDSLENFMECPIHGKMTGKEYMRLKSYIPLQDVPEEQAEPKASNLEVHLYYAEAEIRRLKANLREVDDFLCGWNIAASKKGYKAALHQYVSMEIVANNDPLVSEVARNRLNKIAELKSKYSGLKSYTQKLLDAVKDHISDGHHTGPRSQILIDLVKESPIEVTND